MVQEGQEMQGDGFYGEDEDPNSSPQRAKRKSTRDNQLRSTYLSKIGIGAPSGAMRKRTIDVSRKVPVLSDQAKSEEEIKEECSSDSKTGSETGTPDETKEVISSFSTEASPGYSLDIVQPTKMKGRTDQEIRKRFMEKLVHEKVWLLPGEKPKSDQTCVIFDWDDTILCTSFLHPTGSFEDYEPTGTLKK